MKSFPLIPACTLIVAALLSSDASAQTTVCVRVKLEIPQRLTFERDAFEATLRLTNRLDDAPLEELDVDVVVRPISAGAPADAIFVAPPALTGVANSVDGDGVIGTAAQGAIQYLLIPTAGAGGTSPGGLQYAVKALIRYKVGAVFFDAETFEEIITVKPQPELGLHYFLPRRVNADTPFELGVRVENTGFGTARNLQIESAQPRIVENLSGLLINFALVGTFRNADVIPDTLAIPFGDLEPERCGMGAWAMTTSLDGEFIELDVSMKHAEELGGELTSLLKSTETDFLIRRVVDDRAGRDVIFDAAIDLAIGGAEADDGIPDLILGSDCSEQPIAAQTATTTGTPGIAQPFGGLSTNLDIGWNYTRGVDLAGGTLPLLRVTRVRDGKVLHPQNAWLDVDDDLNPIVSLVDFSVAGAPPGETLTEDYTITYDLSDFDVTPPVTRIVPRAPFAFRADGSLVVTPTTVMILAADDDASGVASITLSIDGGQLQQNRPFFFAAGTHTVSFQSSDARGNLEALKTTTVIVDDTAPTVAFTAPDLLVTHPENLSLAFDFDVDDDTDPALAVTATVVRSGGADLFTVVDGQVLAPFVLAPGLYFLRIELADHVENADTAVIGPFEIVPRVALPPRLISSGISDGAFVNAPVTLSAAIEADDVLVTSSLTLDGEPFVSGTVVSAEGPHTLLMNAEDVAGRIAAESLSFTVDLTAPSVQVQGVAAGSVSATPVAPTALFADENLVSTTLKLDGVDFTSGTIVDVEGQHLIEASATDRAGNITVLTVPFAVDIASPRIVFSGFTLGALHPAPVRPAFTVEDTSTTSVIALIDGKDFVPGALIGDGDHRLEVTALDVIGRATTAVATFAVDATPPSLRILGVVEGGIYATGVAAFVAIEEPRLLETVILLDGAAYVEGTPITTEGTHTLSVSATDTAGHTATDAVSFDVDADVPTIFVSGVDDGAVYTGSVLPVVTTDDPADTIVLLLDTVPYDGTSSISAEGKHVLAVTATDPQGNTARLEVRFTIDGTPPAVVVTGVVDGGVYADPVTPNVVLESDDIRSVDALLDGVAFLPGTTVSALGTHLLEIVVRDQAENETRLLVTFVIDPNAPRLLLSGASDGAYVNTPVTIDVDAPAGAALTLTLDDLPYVAGTVIASEGRHVVRAVADVGAAQAIAGLTFTIDTTAPVVVVDAAGVALVEGLVLRGPVAVSFSATDAFLNTTAALIDDLVFDTGDLIESEGAHVVVVTASDRAGNETVVSIGFTLDRTDPVVTIDNIVEGAVLNSAVIPQVAVVDDNPGTVVISVDGRALDPGAAVATAGAHRLDVKAVDAAGNIGEATVSFSIVLDTPFSLRVTRRGAPATGDRVHLFTGFGESTGLVAVVDDAGNAVFADVDAGSYRARVEHLWQRFFTPVFSVPGGRVLFDIPDEPTFDATVYVDPKATEQGTGTEDDPFSSLQVAVDDAVFNTLIKVAAGDVGDVTTLRNGVTVKGGHQRSTWRFAPTTQTTRLARVELEESEAELSDVVVFGGGVALQSATALLRDVVVRESATEGISVQSGDVVLANLLVEQGLSQGVVIRNAVARVENLTVVDNEGAGLVHGGTGSVARVIAVDNGGGISLVGGATGIDNLEVDVGFVEGPLHTRYLAQVRSGQDGDSPAVDHASVSAASLDLRGRTTSTTGLADVGNADIGYHAWPVAPEPPDPPDAPDRPEAPWCAGAPGSSAPIVVLALLLLRRRRRVL
ncbi:MAG: hypothetical protein Q8O67_03105 [Deltaproteobacteria bacterium]|nr:hypothetical protein [Deltaproteobacteria bacterium]